MFDILQIFCNGSSTLPRIFMILTINHDPSTGGRGICLLEGGHVARDVVEVERNCTSMGETDLIITLRSN